MKDFKTLMAWCQWARKKSGVSEFDLDMVKDIEDLHSLLGNYQHTNGVQAEVIGDLQNSSFKLRSERDSYVALVNKILAIVNTYISSSACLCGHFESCESCSGISLFLKLRNELKEEFKNAPTILERFQHPEPSGNSG